MMRISPSITMMGVSDKTRKISLEIVSLLAVKPGDVIKQSKFSAEYHGVDADEVWPGIFIGNK